MSATDKSAEFEHISGAIVAGGDEKTLKFVVSASEETYAKKLSSEIAPVCRGLVRRRMLRFWTYVWDFEEILVFTRPTRRLSEPELEKLIEKVGGKHVPNVQAGLARARGRYGGDSGIRIHARYCRIISPFVAEILEFMTGSPEAPPQEELVLTFLFYLKDVLGFPEALVGAGVRDWCEHYLELYAKKAGSSNLGELIQARADEELKSNDTLGEMLRGLVAQGWRGQLPEGLDAALRSHEGRLRRVGRMLQGNLAHFLEPNPWQFVFFYTYVHPTLLLLNVDTRSELFFLRLFSESWRKFG
jgi:hypothetical protein